MQVPEPGKSRTEASPPPSRPGDAASLPAEQRPCHDGPDHHGFGERDQRLTGQGLNLWRVPLDGGEPEELVTLNAYDVEGCLGREIFYPVYGSAEQADGTALTTLTYTAYKYPVQINADGTVSPSEAPGANFDINREVLEPYRVG